MSDQTPQEQAVEVMADTYARWRQDCPGEIDAATQGPYAASVENARIFQEAALQTLLDARVPTPCLECGGTGTDPRTVGSPAGTWPHEPCDGTGELPGEKLLYALLGLEQVGWIEASGTIEPGSGELMKVKCTPTCQFCFDAEPLFRLSQEERAQ